MNALQAGNVRNHLTVVPGNKVEGLSTLSARSNQYLGGNDPFGHPFHPGAKLSGEGKCDAVRCDNHGRTVNSILAVHYSVSS